MDPAQTSEPKSQAEQLLEEAKRAELSTFKYATWRTEVPKVPGFSHELISVDTERILHQTDIEALECVPHPGYNTLYELVQMQLERIPNNDVFGTRVGDEYQWITWRQTCDISEHLSYGMMELGLVPQVDAEDKQWRFMGILAKNRKEWYLTHIANMYQTVTTVAFYETLGQEAMRYVCNQTELKTIAMSPDQVLKVAQMKLEDDEKSMMRRVEAFIVFGDIESLDQEARDTAKQAGIKLVSFDDVVEIGREANAKGRAKKNLPTKDDIFMLSYTSGTTGDPKGVKMSHKMLQSVGAVVKDRITIKFNEDDVYCSYLPAAHSYEQANFINILHCGMKCGFFSGDPLKLIEDLGILKPTCFQSVPRLFNKICSSIQAKFKEAEGCSAWLVNKAVTAKLENLKAGAGMTHAIYDRLIFNKVKQVLGGRVKLMTSGSAPISADTLDFLKICFCCEILEGYGMTETAASCSVQFEGDPMTGIVGGPTQGMKIKLRDMPEMGYLNTNEVPTGELCLKGGSVMTGYFKNPEKTKETFTSDGWLLTGDVACVLPNGSFKIIDRAKNIFKLSQGEYIAPEKIENVIMQTGIIAQAWVYGDSLRDHILMFLVLDLHFLKKFAEKHGVTGEPNELIENETIRSEIYFAICTQAKSQKLNSLETPKQMKLILEPFSVDNGTMTPTMKIKRNAAKEFLKADIDAVYAQPVMTNRVAK